MSERVDEAVARIQHLSLRGMSADELLEHIASCLGPDLTPITLMATCMRSFDVPLGVLQERVVGWIGVGRAGADTPTTEVAEVLAAYINDYVATERGPDLS